MSLVPGREKHKFKSPGVERNKVGSRNPERTYGAGAKRARGRASIEVVDISGARL